MLLTTASQYTRVQITHTIGSTIEAICGRILADISNKIFLGKCQPYLIRFKLADNVARHCHPHPHPHPHPRRSPPVIERKKNGIPMEINLDTVIVVVPTTEYLNT